MQSDQSIHHIALTCPHCGKHYKKVPYEAIKKHQFAFCKQCNKKFRVDPSALEDALRQAEQALAGQSLESAALPDQYKEAAPEQPQEPASVPDHSSQRPDAQTIPGLQHIVQQAAAAAQDFLPEPSAADEQHDGGGLAKLFDSQQSQAEEQPGIQGSFQHDMDRLAATLDETFSQPREHHPEEGAAGVAGETIFSGSAQFEPIPETAQPYPAPPSVSDLKEPEDSAAGEPVPGQPDEPAAEEHLEREAREESFIQQQGADAPLTSASLPDTNEENLADDLPVPASAETGMEDEIFETIMKELPGGAPLESAAGQEPPEASPAENLPVPASTKTAFQDKTIEELIEALDVEAPLNSAADLEPLEEPLAENVIVATQTESAPGEETLDESLIEEPDSAQFEQESAYAIQEQGKTLAATNRDFPAPPEDTAANRDVASMLKDIVLPSADIREGMEQFVLFSLGEQLFAAPVANVAELSLPPDCIMLPNTPQWLLGIANMRGEIISIADLRGFLSMDQESIKKTSRMIIAQTLDRQMMVGLIVGRINGIHYFATDDICPFEQQAPGPAAAYISGTCAYEDTVVAILDLEKLLQSPKMGQFQ
jgi:chemotaxis signal transduction protein